MPRPPTAAERHWLDAFEQFFNSVNTRLATVLAAESCREAWLHGEMFLHFINKPGCDTFRVNSYPLGAGARHKVDIGCDGRYPMRGEVKVLGAGYKPKVITGGALRPPLWHLPRLVTPADRSTLCLGPWGLIPDYFRLIDPSAEIPKGAARILILVAHLPPQVTTNLGNALRVIDFEGVAPAPVTFPGGSVRMWAVP